MSWKVNSVKVVYELVDTETGEIISEERVLGEETKKTKRTRTKKIEDDDPIAKITVLDNKLQLNNAAIELTGFQPDDKVAIKFEKKGRITNPVIMLDEKEGNRLTKTNTISCRGSKRDEILKFGNIFTIEEHPSVVGTFLMKGNIEIEDDIVDIPEEIASDEEIDNSFDASDGDINFDDFQF
jgi:hypothetical protein